MEEKEAEMLLDALVNRAKEMLVRDKKLVPVVFLLLPGKRFNVMPLKFENTEEKEATVAFVKAVAKGVGADAIVFISEAWSIMRDKLPEDGSIPRASLAPDRKECIAATIVTRTGYEGAITVPFERDKDDTPVFIEAGSGLPKGIYEGAKSLFSDTFHSGFGIDDYLNPPPEGSTIQ